MRRTDVSLFLKVLLKRHICGTPCEDIRLSRTFSVSYFYKRAVPRVPNTDAVLSAASLGSAVVTEVFYICSLFLFQGR